METGRMRAKMWGTGSCEGNNVETGRYEAIIETGRMRVKMWGTALAGMRARMWKLEGIRARI